MKLKDIKGLYNVVNRGYTLTDNRDFIKITGGHYFIYWSSYGSSAIKNKLLQFRWLMDTIYKDYTIDDIIIK